MKEEIRDKYNNLLGTITTNNQGLKEVRNTYNVCLAVYDPKRNETRDKYNVVLTKYDSLTSILQEHINSTSHQASSSSNASPSRSKSENNAEELGAAMGEALMNNLPIKAKLIIAGILIFGYMYYQGTSGKSTQTDTRVPTEATQKSENVAPPATIPSVAPVPAEVPVAVSTVEVVTSVPASASVSSSNTSEWVKIFGREKDAMYVDHANIRKTDNVATMWIMFDEKTAQTHSISGKPYLSQKKPYEFNCNENQLRYLGSISLYAGNMATGEVVYASSASIPDKWEQVTPNSTLEKMWKIACGETT